MEIRGYLRHFTDDVLHEQFKEVDEAAKRCFGERDIVIAGIYLMTAKLINKDEYIVKARQERRVTVSRF